MHYIYIDIGNTLTKYTISNAAQVFQIKTKDLEKVLDFNEINDWKAIDLLKNVKIKVYISCVRQGLQKKINNYFWAQADVKFLNYKNQNIINISSENAGQEIGADILANAIAASELHSNTIVVSLGTAIVYFVLINNTIKGVAIDAGFSLSWKKFLQEIWGKEENAWPQLIKTKHLLGLDTNSALSSGFVNSKIFAINGFVKNLKNAKSQIIITGGDYINLAPNLKNHLEFDFIYQPNLVLRGLEIWAQKAQKKDH